MNSPPFSIRDKSNFIQTEKKPTSYKHSYSFDKQDYVINKAFDEFIKKNHGADQDIIDRIKEHWLDGYSNANLDVLFIAYTLRDAKKFHKHESYTDFVDYLKDKYKTQDTDKIDQELYTWIMKINEVDPL